MNKKRDLAAEQRAEAEAAFREENSLIWNLDRLQECFRDQVPASLSMEVKTLAFTPDLLADITEDDIKALASCFGLTDSRRYTHWIFVYEMINRLFRGSDEASTLVAKIARVIPASEKGGAVFLAIAWAYIVDHGQNDLTRKVREAKKEIKVIDGCSQRIQRELEKLADLGDQSALDKASQEIRFAVTLRRATRESLIKVAEDVLPGNQNESARNDLIYRAFGFVKDEMIRKVRKRGAVQNTLRLFDDWDMELEEDAVRKQKSRGKQNSRRT